MMALAPNGTPILGEPAITAAQYIEKFGGSRYNILTHLVLVAYMVL
jgi:hypothetical protein